MADLWGPVNGVFTASAPETWAHKLAFLDKFEWFPFVMTAAAAFVTALVGAWVGAKAAGRIAKRNKQLDVVTDEIRANNMAMLLAQQVFKLGLALKIDAVKPMTDAYNKARTEYLDPKISKISEAQNLQKVNVINPAIDTLRTCALERITLPGQAIRAVLQVVESLECLNRSLASRNELADLFMHKQFPPGMSFLSMYLGVPSEDGTCHTGYMDNMKSMARYTDEVVFFSLTLCQMLDEHGVKLRKESKKLAKSEVAINRFRLAPGIPEGIIPDAKSYAKWFAGYEPHVDRKKWWQFWRK